MTVIVYYGFLPSGSEVKKFNISLMHIVYYQPFMPLTRRYSGRQRNALRMRGSRPKVMHVACVVANR